MCGVVHYIVRGIVRGIVHGMVHGMVHGIVHHTAALHGALRGASLQVLNWASFLHTAAQLSPPPPHPSPLSLPPPLTPAAELAAALALLPEDSGWWGRLTLAGWRSMLTARP